MLRFMLTAWLCLFAVTAKTAEPPRDHLWMTVTLRAAPGELKAVIADLNALRSQGYYASAGRRGPLTLRHSQGDQWDLMLLEPVSSYSAYFAPARLQKETESKQTFAQTLHHIEARTAFRDTLFAYGPAPEFVQKYIEGKRFFHIEMFNALAGKNQALIAEREMENAYLESTGRRGNLIFAGDMGSDVDNFTIGAYASLAAFAGRPDKPAAYFDQAAKAAGFADGDSIGFYLRRLIAAHHDTLANLVD